MSGSRIGGMVCLLLALGLGAPISAAIIQVPGNQPTIQLAINAALPGDVIQVQPGTYVENIDFLGKSLSLQSVGGPEVTTIDGSALTRGAGEGSTIICDSGETSSTQLIGFTITGGSGRLVGVLDGGGSLLGNFTVGGGLLAQGGSPSVQDCLFTGNSAQFGAGAYFESGGPASMTSCEFVSNSGLQGSGLYLRLLTGLSSISGCTFQGNDAATAGGGLMIEDAGAVISGSAFTGNSAILGGGATLQRGVVLITSSTFSGNSATLLGGGVLVFDATATVQQSRFDGNTGGTGGAIGCDRGSTTLDRCVIVGNQAFGDGGAIALSNNPVNLAITRATIADNTSPTSGGIFIPATATSTGTITNSILWGNSGIQIVDAGQISATFSDVQGGEPGIGNLNFDPLFVNQFAGDYSLTPPSPAIDSGDPTSALDPDGTNRDQGAIFFDQRPANIASLVCTLLDPCNSSFDISWTNPDFYDSIELSVDGIVLSNLPGSQQSATVLLGTPGIHDVCLTPTFGSFVGNPTCCQANAPTNPAPQPVIGLACLLDEPSCTSLVTWTNAGAYGSLDVLLDGALFTTLPGNATTVVVPVASGAISQVCITGAGPCGLLAIPPSCCSAGCNIDFEPFKRGDANGDGGLDISDPLTDLLHTFQGAPLGCLDAGDTNDDGAIDVADAILLLDYIFGGGATPPSPGIATCGTDPTDTDPLNCVTYSSCP